MTNDGTVSLYELSDGSITQTMTTACYPNDQTTGTGSILNCYTPIYWNSYPVYVCTDKTKKAIDILKALQAEKMIKCDSVPRFIGLVEKISNLL